ncbi:hypothetical protein [Glycomyces dulcitolivorans]|uniref:hypothetical protein n=1 Tax=Glycomyces dulcitolivorans TaxID=2200759 RepID=UPI0018E56BB1|nr:hypothetical protein [Glycomyces dulcitolivorans]
MTNQTWIITGATSGLGRSIALAALDAGANIVAAVRRPEALADEVAPFGVRVMIVEPSRFRTGFHGALEFSATSAEFMIAAYGDDAVADSSG